MGRKSELVEADGWIMVLIMMKRERRGPSNYFSTKCANLRRLGILYCGLRRKLSVEFFIVLELER